MMPTKSILKNSLKALLATAALVAGPALASTHALPYSFTPDTGNLASVQRGARNYMSYCSGCHSMRHLRYSRMAQDLQIPEDLLKANLMFTSDKVGDHILSAMPSDAAKNWFGQPPPDLTLEARYRGADWVYSYLLSFYVDSSRPLGTNNLVLPNASMPNVLWELQGLQVEKTAAHEGEAAHHEGSPFEAVTQGKLSAEEYQKWVADTANFMAYAAEPGRAQRVSTGFKVLLFLFVFTILAYLMKREWWRDVH
ncbi:ubiquinol-cytochrome c reductase cytochrome c1 subunit [Solimonas aquatica]|uniref:Ubiquinol-cytochrome c reductase cytochrome c1 subunit n=1 Tax=Solimonas aquatica TaxID=489703 RepID=A0A1H9CV43_9GAMM|nr:cytochrome c1 [Solimonas aquatica]SEQ05086.1 ubiquinol-cytochrome c reductase cytochrome c1 subunit [Solimonas aquatica]